MLVRPGGFGPVLFNCGEDEWDGVAAGFNGAELTCLDNLEQAACADHVAHPDCAGDPESLECLTNGLTCQDANLVQGACAQVQGCPQFAPGFAAPAASGTGLVGLAFLLAGAGVYYVRQRSTERR
jgi:hypothetical protein